MHPAAPFIRLARPHQYVKNVFVLMPLFFAGGITRVELLLPTLMAFAAFSLVASSIYVLNDLKDAEEDSIHPEKQCRPIAAGEVSLRAAGVFSAGLMAAGLILAGSVSFPVFALLLGYALLNIAYSLHLKQVSLLDVTIIAIGFVLRLFVGSFAGGIPLSQWIVVTTFLLALFLALAKRRDDLLIQDRTGQPVRIASRGYTLGMIDSSITILAAAVVVTYLLYTTSGEVTDRIGSEHLYLTTIFVILGILRYLQITFVHENSGSPTQVFLHDSFTQINLLFWVLSFGVLLYL